MTSSDMRVRVLLSVQRALVGYIGIAVGAIVCRWTQDKIHVRTVFGGVRLVAVGEGDQSDEFDNDLRRLRDEVKAGLWGRAK